MRGLLVSLIAWSLLQSSALAADIGAPGAMCRIVGPSHLLTIESPTELSKEVVRLMTEAVNVADSDEWIDSRKAAFTWASEAKVACGKAYGYLKTNHRDEDYLNKCECFHQRMVNYM